VREQEAKERKESLKEVMQVLLPEKDFERIEPSDYPI
jgi:hypothetical protein